MCYKVECKGCGKTGWGGCGKHLVPLYNGIAKGSHCMCRSWPGVVVPSTLVEVEQPPPPHQDQKDAHQPPPPPAASAATAASGSVATAATAGSSAGEMLK